MSPRLLDTVVHMIRILDPVLRSWEAADSGVRAVMVRGAGGKAFCAGGDIRAITEVPGGDMQKTFFREEYQLDHLVGRLDIPYIAVMNGITMGGGVGIQRRAAQRQTESAAARASRPPPVWQRPPGLLPAAPPHMPRPSGPPQAFGPPDPPDPPTGDPGASAAAPVRSVSSSSTDRGSAANSTLHASAAPRRCGVWWWLLALLCCKLFRLSLLRPLG